jgi:DNA-binding MarR family transcriptional regulator
MLPVAPDGQDPNLGVLLFVASRSLEQRAHDAIIAAGFTDITQAQARAAARIDPDGTRVSELAERAQITKQSAAFLVGQLEDAGYVERTPDPTDGRAQLVHLTAKAAGVVAAANTEVERTLAEWARHVGAPRLEELYRTLADLREITDPWL